MPIARFSPIGVGSTLRSLEVRIDPGKVIDCLGLPEKLANSHFFHTFGPIVPLKPLPHRGSEELTGLLVFPEAPHFAGPRLVVQ